MYTLKNTLSTESDPVFSDSFTAWLRFKWVENRAFNAQILFDYIS
jgi:hypothetical protein